jgi:transmembrane protein 33
LIGGPDSFAALRRLLMIVCSKDRDIFRFVAINEILLMPTIILMIFSGKGGFFMPFIYYRFLGMRYQSRRNPYNRIMFYELRVSIEYYTSQASCPRILQTMAQKVIATISRMAPPPQTAAA